MTEDPPAQRGDSSRDDSSDVGSNPGAGSPAQDKGKGVARNEDMSGGGEGDNNDGGSAAEAEAGAGADEDEDDANESEEWEHDDSDDDEDEEEPKLKYARLTQHLGPVYRNGDATSAFLVAGDKMVRSALPSPTRRC